jgi:hypothetical protein
LSLTNEINSELRRFGYFFLFSGPQNISQHILNHAINI